MVGAFPPPVHGLAQVNAAVRAALEEHGARPIIVDLAATGLGQSLRSRLGRLPTVVRGWLRFATLRRCRGGSFYISISGGLGQIYEFGFIALARLRGMRCHMHHHSFAYIDRPRRMTSWLLWLGGASAVHIALSPRMAQRLQSVYGVCNVTVVSNALTVVRTPPVGTRPRTVLRSLGFIGNISDDKGVFEFLSLLQSLSGAGLPIAGKLAGPFQDAQTQQRVISQLSPSSDIEYRGPVYGSAKDAFFEEIDALIFPSRYANEADPLTIHEAMMRGIPVIAYGRGAISEIVTSECGLVVRQTAPFVELAHAQIVEWVRNPLAFESASKGALIQSATIRERDWTRWQELLAGLLK